nr:hypothetical protein [Tanacetum cinerariifolium]
MAPKKRTTRESPATTTTTTTPMTDAQLKALIAQGVADVLAKCDATRRIALTWWNSHVKTVTHDVAYAMTWKTLKKMMTDNVIASKPKIMKDEIEFATELMDKKISTFAERQAENKRKLDNNNQAQQQPLKNQGVAIDYISRSSERKEYVGTLLLCNKCKFHHNGQCTVKNLTCYECVNQGHYTSDCPELKNQNHGNQARGTGARRMVHALEGGETNQDLNNMEDDING